MYEGLYARTLRDWDRRLGDPERDGPLSFSAAARRDQSGAFPEDALQLLGQLGLSLLHIPAERGGGQRSLEQIIAASYAVGRRDASVSLTSGLQMWSQLAWMAGSPSHQRYIQSLLEDNGGICLAASEAEHGADLLATSCRAESDGAGYSLSGSKWPIGRAGHSRAAFILARTGAERGPRALSWFLLDGEALSHPSCRRLDKEQTLGLRASDVSGLAFDRLPLEAGARVGEPGAGFELALKVLQLTRPLVASLSLGPADTALRLAVRFAEERRLYGATAAELPTVRRALCRAWVSLGLAEAIEVGAARTAHLHPGSFSIASLAAKICVPALAQRCVEEGGRVLGARLFLCSHAHGMFQKIVRDLAVMPVFDGSTDVCVHALAMQLPLLLARRSAQAIDPFALLCAPGEEVPALDYPRLAIDARGVDPALGSVERWAEQVRPPDARAWAEFTARYIRGRLLEMSTSVLALRERLGAHASRTLELADAASEYARLHALALAVGFAARAEENALWGRADWLWSATAALGIALPSEAPGEPDRIDTLFAELREKNRRGALFSPLCGDER